MGEGTPEAGTVLIVDDDADVLRTVERALAAYVHDLQVVTAGSPDEALERLDELDVALILTDYRMPDMDGLRLLKKAEEIAPGTPRVLMTAYPDMQLAIDAVNEHKILAFLTKPLDPEELIQVVEHVVVDKDEDALRRLGGRLGPDQVADQD